MAITRTQIAKQLLSKGGRIGLRGGGADMGTVSTPGRAARDNREIGARMSRTAASGQGDAMRRNQEAFDTGVDKGYYQTFKTEVPKDVNAGFSSILFNSKLGKDFRKFMRDKNVKYFEDTFDGPLTLSNYKQFYSDLADRFKGKDDGLGDADYLLPINQSGIMAEAPSDMDQEPEVEEPFEVSRRFRADGGRIGFRGGDAAKSDAASGRDAGRADPGGGVDDRSDAGQTAVNNAAIMMAQMQNQNLDKSPNLIEKFPGGVRAIDKINLDRMIADMNLNTIKEEEDEDTNAIDTVFSPDIAPNLQTVFGTGLSDRQQIEKNILNSIYKSDFKIFNQF